jgi:uncharacterized protein (DUF2062 family)
VAARVKVLSGGSGFWRRRILDPVLALLRQGVTPEKIAMGMALGMTLGVAPMIGSTTILCVVAAFVLRLNPAAIQIVNYLMSPFQLALLIPFIRAGERLFGAAQSELTLNRIRELVQANMWHAIVTLWTATVHAMAVWFCLGALLVFPLYWLLLGPLRRLARIRVTNSYGVAP